ncbi:MAG: ATP synthase F0 subunit B, partial [Spirulinaceae cyanobacterium RM2_2_10]|nr:ATP synthase F0 subunit B [Spirulinaceae cyanobacterium RM2_2_10]
LVRINLPRAFEEALTLLRQRDELLLQAEDYAREIVEAAQQQAVQLVDEMGIIRQAEVEAAQLRQQVQQDCEELQRRTLNDIEQMRLQAVQDIEQMRQLALGECEDIQEGADEYADAVLSRIELQLGEMMRVIRNGRSQLRSGGQVSAADANALP